jgi:RNA polymerase sigma factor (TIGR02999 family)
LAEFVKTKATWKLFQVRRKRGGSIPGFAEETRRDLPLAFACRKEMSMNEVTRILDAIGQGDGGAAAQLLPLVYDELRRLAAAQMAREKPGQTLNATALVHEAYLRLAGDQQFDNRRHFFAAAAEAMRRILVENARRKRSLKRGGDRQRLDFNLEQPVAVERIAPLLALDEALDRLEARDAEKAQLVKLRYFAGMTIEQAAETLGISVTTANRWWSYARAWLHEEIRREPDNTVA